MVVYLLEHEHTVKASRIQVQMVYFQQQPQVEELDNIAARLFQPLAAHTAADIQPVSAAALHKRPWAGCRPRTVAS